MTALSAIASDVVMQLPDIPAAAPVLIAGPTASGKSALALHIAQNSGGRIINADALQVFNGWRLLTARPSDTELSIAEHQLYGHVPLNAPYSVGHWLRDVEPHLIGERPIVVGGTGLYFRALTNGLAPIPPTPKHVRLEADHLALPTLLNGLDPATLAQIDTLNRARVQRAWEVQVATGQSILDWQAQTPAPLLNLANCIPLVLQPEPRWLNDRIEARFDMMLEKGALNEAASLKDQWDPNAVSAKAIGASELMAHLNGQMTLQQAREAAIIASRQYGKRQRTWFRSQMGNWTKILLGT